PKAELCHHSSPGSLAARREPFGEARREHTSERQARAASRGDEWSTQSGSKTAKLGPHRRSDCRTNRLAQDSRRRPSPSRPPPRSPRTPRRVFCGRSSGFHKSKHRQRDSSQTQREHSQADIYPELRTSPGVLPVLGKRLFRWQPIWSHAVHLN